MSYPTRFPKWFASKYRHELSTTASSSQGNTSNLIVVSLGTEQEPDLPQQIFNDLKKLAKETHEVVEGIFTLKPTGRQSGGEAGKFTVQPDGCILQDSTQTGEFAYLRKNYFSGPNALKTIK